MVPERISTPLLDHLNRVKEIHASDLAAGYERVPLPFALDASIRTLQRIGFGSMSFRNNGVG